MANLLQSKRFVVRQSLIGKDTNVEVSFKNGKIITYSHDKAFEVMKSALEAMNCWSKYKSYTATNNIPKVLRESDAVIETIESAEQYEQSSQFHLFTGKSNMNECCSNGYCEFDSHATTKIKTMTEIEEFDKWLHELIKQNGITNY